MQVKAIAVAAMAATLVGVAAFAQESPQNFLPEQIRAGAELYQINCSPCHGSRMLDPQGAYNLRNFPRGQRERFADSIVHGRNQMPPWGDFFRPDQLDSLWAYVSQGERN